MKCSLTQAVFYCVLADLYAANQTYLLRSSVK